MFENFIHAREFHSNICFILQVRFTTEEPGRGVTVHLLLLFNDMVFAAKRKGERSYKYKCHLMLTSQVYAVRVAAAERRDKASTNQIGASLQQVMGGGAGNSREMYIELRAVSPEEVAGGKRDRVPVPLRKLSDVGSAINKLIKGRQFECADSMCLDVE